MDSERVVAIDSGHGARAVIVVLANDGRLDYSFVSQREFP